MEKEMNENTTAGEAFLTGDSHENYTDREQHYVSRVEELEAQVEDFRNKLLYQTAEFDNYRRRTNEEKNSLIQYANQRLLERFLEIPDDMTMALDAARKAKDDSPLMKGIEMIYSKVFKLFEDAGVKPMPAQEGEEFNVDFHEALMAQPSDSIPEGHIVQVLQNGYILGEKVLRHAKVITSSGKA